MFFVFLFFFPKPLTQRVPSVRQKRNPFLIWIEQKTEKENNIMIWRLKMNEMNDKRNTEWKENETEKKKEIRKRK